nr:hypothetical protein [Pseudopedobacter sp.]
MYLNNLQSYIFGSILLLMVCFAACEKSSDTSPAFDLGESVVIKKADQVYLAKNTPSQLKIIVNDIKDSRCPMNTTCVWAGEAVVKLIVSNTEEHSASFDLVYGTDSEKDTVDFSIDQKAYRAILKNVTPYPVAGVSQDSSKAEILITQK